MGNDERMYRHEQGGQVWYSNKLIDGGPIGDLIDEHPIVSGYILAPLMGFMVGIAGGVIIWACGEYFSFWSVIIYIVTAIIGRAMISVSSATRGNYIWAVICTVASYIIYLCVSTGEFAPSALTIVFQILWLIIVLVAHVDKESKSNSEKDTEAETE